MQNLIRVIAISCALVLLTVGSALAQQSASRGSGSARQVFEQALAARGEWREVAPYGRVWKPNARLVGDNFTPYGSGGHWTYTELGWSFESNWDWGWVPFHYGRWAKAPDAGWVWVPGTEWAPAWVDWRIGNGWVGWAPLPPGARTVEHADAGWTFVRLQQLLGTDVAAQAAPPAQVAQLHRLTAPSRVAVPGQRWTQGPAARWQSPSGEVIVRPARIVPPRRGRIERARIDP